MLPSNFTMLSALNIDKTGRYTLATRHIRLHFRWSNDAATNEGKILEIIIGTIVKGVLG